MACLLDRGELSQGEADVSVGSVDLNQYDLSDCLIGFIEPNNKHVMYGAVDYSKFGRLNEFDD